MLVLTRKIGESIQIGDSIVLEVAAVQGKRVRLAIQAPQEVEIRRGELDAKRDQDTSPLAPVKAVTTRAPNLPLASNLILR